MIIWFSVGLILAVIIFFAAGVGGLLMFWEKNTAGDLLWGLFFWWISFGCGLWAYNLLK